MTNIVTQDYDMGNQTTVTTVTLAGGLATLTIWITGVYAPELMAQAPAGVEAAITVIFSSLIAYFKSYQTTDYYRSREFSGAGAESSKKES